MKNDDHWSWMDGFFFREQIVSCRKMVTNGIEFEMVNYQQLNIVPMDLMIYYG